MTRPMIRRMSGFTLQLSK